LKSEALRLGFEDVAIAPAVAAPGYANFLNWLEAGHAASMDYMSRHATARAHPSNVLEGVRSIVVLSVVYGRNESSRSPLSLTSGKVARYARGADYHRVLRDKLETLLAWLITECPTLRGRVVVDTAPILERDYARLAGLGWIGKNTMLISRRLGSFTFLAALLIDADLEYDPPHHANHCGTCTRCLEACPTQAFPAPYQLDSRKCISYWTIEHKGMLPDEAATSLDGWVFGCDICQDVCPWNRKARPGRLSEFQPRPEWSDPDLIEWFTYDVLVWNKRLAGTALTRSKRAGLLRNAALVLGTRGLPEAVAPLTGRLDDKTESAVVRAAAAWALGRIGTSPAQTALVRHCHDAKALVRDAVERALERIQLQEEKASGPGIDELPQPAIGIVAAEAVFDQIAGAKVADAQSSDQLVAGVVEADGE
jgi:epoxyqueuosine reductase